MFNFVLWVGSCCMKNKICFGCFESKNTDEEICSHCGFEAESNSKKYPHALPCGTILGGKYVLGRVLGQGGFGITYIAQDYISKELVAIKEFFPEAMATRTQTTVSAFSGQHTEGFDYGKRCFLEEAKTLAEFIGNPNIVRVYSFFEENNTAYFVMEYVEGTSLKSYLKNNNGKISVDEAKKILFPVMDALSVVHSKGIIHRDISPDNIFITPCGEVKLIDFGAARYSIGDKSRSLDVVLKHGYAPKEQYTRRGRQGPYTDVYALGATFYRAITGKVPPDSIDRMEEDSLAMPSSLGCKISEKDEDALLKALSFQPYDRFQNMQEFKASFDTELTVPVLHVTDDKNVTVDNNSALSLESSEVSSESIESKESKFSKNKKLFIVLASVATVVIIVTVLMILFFTGSSSSNDLPETTIAMTTQASDIASENQSGGTNKPQASTAPQESTKAQETTTATEPETKPKTTKPKTTKPSSSDNSNNNSSSNNTSNNNTSNNNKTETTKPVSKPVTKPSTKPAVKKCTVETYDDTMEVEVGSTVTYILHIDSEEKFLDGQFITYYDSDFLELVSASFPVIDDDVIYNTSVDGQVYFNFSSYPEGADFTDGGSLIEIKFKVTSEGEAVIGTYFEILSNIDEEDAFLYEYTETLY